MTIPTPPAVAALEALARERTEAGNAYKELEARQLAPDLQAVEARASGAEAKLKGAQ